MDSKKIVFRETAVVAVGQVICTSVMILIFVLLDKFDKSVLIGSIVGSLVATINFFFMAVGANLAADKAVEQDVKAGKNIIHVSFMVRYLLIAIILFAFAKSGIGNAVTLVLPLIFTRFILAISEFFRKKGDDKS